jgi:hypothetical protein
MKAPRTDELLAALTLPELKEEAVLIEEGDALITCAGFEDRALEFLKRCVTAGSKSFRLLGVKYLPEVPENRIAELKQLADASAADVVLETYDRQEPPSIATLLKKAESANGLWVDISGMSRLLIVQLVACGVRRNPVGKMRIVYTEAESYPPSKQEFANKLVENQDYLSILNFISSGVYGVTIVPELSTVAMQGQPIRLVAFPSFNATQLAAVTAEIQASSLTIINGIPPRTQSLWRKDAIRQLNNVELIREKEEFDTSTLDYRDTLRVLLKLYAKHGATQKIVISPTGSKMQTVAVALMCGFLGDVQVIYPTPQSFPTPSNYTKGVRKVYYLSLAKFADVATSIESGNERATV